MTASSSVRYHVNPKTGKAAQCNAKVRKCKFSGESGKDNHYSSMEAARAAIKKSFPGAQSSSGTRKVRAKRANTEVTVDPVDPATRAHLDATMNSIMEENGFSKSLRSFVNKHPYKILDKRESTPLLAGYQGALRRLSPNEQEDSLISGQSMASQMGNLMEKVIWHQIVHHPDFKGKAVLGEDIVSTIRDLRKEKEDPDISLRIKGLCATYHLDENHITELVNSKKSLNFPDVIVIDESDPKNIVIRVAEMKASGKNDSSSVPKNIDKMVFDTDKSAITSWQGNPNVSLHRAIYINATKKEAPGKYANESTWKNSIKERGTQGVEVVSNEVGFAWLAGVKDYPEKEYNNLITAVSAIKAKEFAMTVKRNKALCSNCQSAS